MANAAGRRTPLRHSRRGQRAPPPPVGLGARARPGRLFVARPRGAQTAAPAGVAAGGGARWEAAGISGHRLTQDPPQRPAEGDELRGPLGRGGLPVATGKNDLASPQAADYYYYLPEGLGQKGGHKRYRLAPR